MTTAFLLLEGLDALQGIPAPFAQGDRRVKVQAFPGRGIQELDPDVRVHDQEHCRDRVKDLFVEWFERLDLPFKKNLVPLAHNWACESSWLKEWLGVTLFDETWFSHARDGMLLAIAINDKAAMRGEAIPFNRVGLGSLCHKFNIVNAAAHDALADALAEAEVYRALIRML